MSSKEIRREWSFRGWAIKYSHRSKQATMGRFGGGWNWKLGIQTGERSVLISLLVSELKITWPKTKEHLDCTCCL
jgi:hypothetical protein